MIVNLPRNDQPIAGRARGEADVEWYRWFSRIARVLNLGIVPNKGIVMASLSAADIADFFNATGLGNVGESYEGWAICNGNNGTPNLADRFVRAKVTGAGATGGSDSSAHTHAIDHDHGSFTSGSESSHTHGGAGLYAELDLNAGNLAGNMIACDQFAYDVTVTATGWARTDPDAGNDLRGINVNGTSAAGSAHSHSVDVPALTGTSGAASDTENRPAYHELVPLMRLEIV